MIEVEQDELSDYSVEPPVRGNCFAACVASIFERPLADFYDVYDYQGLCRWIKAAYPGVGARSRWHATDDPDRRGTQDDWIDPVPLGSVVPDSSVPGALLWIATAKSPRIGKTAYGPGLHCVVMRGAEMVWDPHPHREQGVGNQYAMTWFEVVDPGRLR